MHFYVSKSTLWWKGLVSALARSSEVGIETSKNVQVLFLEVKTGEGVDLATAATTRAIFL